MNLKDIKYVPLSEILLEYKEKNKDNKYRPAAVGRYGVRDRDSIYNKELAKDYSKNKVIYKDTLTLGMGSVQMDIGILVDDVVFSVSPAYHTFRINTEIVDSEYLKYCLEYRNKEMFEMYVKRSVRQGKTIDIPNWLTYKIPVYNKETQKYIVDVLNKSIEVLDTVKEKENSIDELVKARFVELFGAPVLNPYNWDVVTIGDIVTDVRYGTSRPAVEGGKYPYLRMNNLTYDGHLDLSDMKYIDIPNNEIEKCIVRKGDVLFNRTNSIELVGKTCVFDLDDEMVIAGYIIRVRLNEKLLPIVLSSYMNLPSLKEQLRSMAKGAVNQANINAQELQSIKIYLPPIDLQNKFTTFVEQTDKSKSVCKEKIKKYIELYDKLMNDYFGG